MVEDRFLKRLRKKARKGLRGWPIATVALFVEALGHTRVPFAGYRRIFFVGTPGVL